MLLSHCLELIIKSISQVKFGVVNIALNEDSWVQSKSTTHPSIFEANF